MLIYDRIAIRGMIMPTKNKKILFVEENLKKLNVNYESLMEINHFYLSSMLEKMIIADNLFNEIDLSSQLIFINQKVIKDKNFDFLFESKEMLNCLIENLDFNIEDYDEDDVFSFRSKKIKTINKTGTYNLSDLTNSILKKGDKEDKIKISEKIIKNITQNKCIVVDKEIYLACRIHLFSPNRKDFDLIPELESLVLNDFLLNSLMENEYLLKLFSENKIFYNKKIAIDKGAFYNLENKSYQKIIFKNMLTHKQGNILIEFFSFNFLKDLKKEERLNYLQIIKEYAKTENNISITDILSYYTQSYLFTIGALKNLRKNYELQLLILENLTEDFELTEEGEKIINMNFKV